MNGQNPNNMNNEQVGFGATTLGATTLNNTNQNVAPQTIPNVENIDAIPTPTPMPNTPGEPVINPTPVNVTQNVTPATNPTIEPNSNINLDPLGGGGINQAPAPTSEPVAQPIPGTENQVGMDNLMGNTVGRKNMNFPNQNPTKDVNIGAVPPSSNEKKSKPMSKVLFVLLILVLIAGVAFGVYYFLNRSNSVKLTPKEITLGIGDIVPDDVNSYATNISGNTSLCSVDSNNVDSTQPGNYKVIIKCKDKTYEATVIVTDKTAPQVELNTVFRTINTSVNVDDFVKSCTDPSSCKTSFKNEQEVNTYLQTAGGPYKVEIVATDDNGNEATYTAELYVTSEDVFLYLDCSTSETEVMNYSATKTIEDIFPIARTDFLFLNVARRDYVYKFTSLDEYNQVVGNKDTTITFDSITGNAIYDDANLTLTISTDLPIDKLNSENGGNFPTNYSEIQTLYQTKGYTGFQILNEYPKNSTMVNETGN